MRVMLTVLVCTFLATPAFGQALPSARSWPDERPPRPLASRPVKFPPYEIRTLKNGLQVVLVSHHEQPAVSVRMIVRAGAAQDPREKLGVAMLTAALLDQGAGKRSAQEIADTIDFVGGILGTGAGTDLTYVNAIVLKDSLPLAFQLLADVVRRPTFAAEEIDRQRQQAMSGLKVAAEDPDSLASRVIDRLIYGFHPYGLPGTGTAATLSSLTRQDVVDFHRQYYVPNNALMAIVGDVDPNEAFEGVQQAFGDWASRDVPPFKPIDPPAPTRRVVVIDKPDAVQTEVRVGQIGIARRHDDFLALDQAVKILGGEGANRLQQVLRSQRGLTYGASAELDTYKAAGGIVAETDTRSNATAEVLRVTVDEFLRLQRERVYEGELEGAQAYLAGHFPLTIETPDAIATQVLNHLFYELPLEELQTYPDRVRRVSPDDVQRVARAYLRPDRLAIVLVGNANAFINDLKGVGFTDVERIPIEQVDLLAADLRRGTRGDRQEVEAVGAFVSPGRSETIAYQATPSAAPDQQEQARRLLAKAIEARGGLEALRGVKTIIANATTTISLPTNDKVSAKTRTSIEYPAKIRVDVELPDARLAQVYADGTGWLQDPTGVHDAPVGMLDEFKANMNRDPIRLLVLAADGKLKIALEPEQGHGGRVLKVLSVSGEGLGSVHLHIDPQSGALVKVTSEGGPQMPGTNEEVFDDYRMVDGVNVAFKASVTRGGVALAARELSDVKINTPIPAETFARPR
jgi:zinc protease